MMSQFEYGISGNAGNTPAGHGTGEVSGHAPFAPPVPSGPDVTFRVVDAGAPPALRAEPFWLMRDEGVDRAVFYDQPGTPDIYDWHRVTGPDVALLVRVEHGPRLAAVAWVNMFTGRSGVTHFAVFRAYRPQAVHLGRAFLRWVFATGWFDSLAGITPVTYGHALRFIGRIGFQRAAVLPGACRMARLGRCVDGVISVATPQTLPLISPAPTPEDAHDE